MNISKEQAEVIASAFQEELEKIAISKDTAKALALITAGGVGTETLRRANNDRKMGRMVRMQNGQ